MKNTRRHVLLCSRCFAALLWGLVILCSRCFAPLPWENMISTRMQHMQRHSIAAMSLPLLSETQFLTHGFPQASENTRLITGLVRSTRFRTGSARAMHTARCQCIDVSERQNKCWVGTRCGFPPNIQIIVPPATDSHYVHAVMQVRQI